MLMNAEFTASLRETATNQPAVAQLYAPLLQKQSRDGVICEPELAYGDHLRHRLDLYKPATGVGPWPVVVFLHGGGFIRGSKENRANLGVFLAQQGFIAVLPNYRLAPECVWPCGAEDVIAVWQWVHTHAARWGADPARTVLAGESAGAAHVAAATLRSEFHPPHWAIAGAVLLSGPYNIRLEGMTPTQLKIPTPDPRNESYFGSDRTRWDACSTVDHVTAKPFPLLIGFTELDLIQMQVQAGELFARLVSQHGFQPDLIRVAHHNHFSQSYSLGTGDTSLSEPLLKFLRRITT